MIGSSLERMSSNKFNERKVKAQEKYKHKISNQAREAFLFLKLGMLCHETLALTQLSTSSLSLYFNSFLSPPSLSLLSPLSPFLWFFANASLRSESSGLPVY